MISHKLKLAAVLGIATAVALSAASAEARGGRKATDARAAVSDRYAYQPSNPFNPFDAYAYSPDSSYATQPAPRGYIDDGVGYSGSGTFSDGREVPGTNWNPNQN